jgi:hypothetical protein
MSDAYRHFTHPALILWLTSSLISPSLCNIDLKYRNVSFTGTIYPSKLTSPTYELSPLNWHLICLVLVLLNLKTFDSKVLLHNSSFWSTLILLSSISITSWAKSILQGIFSCMSFMTLSITKMKIYEPNVDIDVILS